MYTHICIHIFVCVAVASNTSSPPQHDMSIYLGQDRTHLVWNQSPEIGSIWLLWDKMPTTRAPLHMRTPWEAAVAADFSPAIISKAITWTPKVCKLIAILTVYSVFGHDFYIHWGSKNG